jgi:hypothetical protein
VSRPHLDRSLQVVPTHCFSVARFGREIASPSRDLACVALPGCLSRGTDEESDD